MNSCIFFLLTFLSLSICHADDGSSDSESQDVLTLHDIPRGNIRGILQLRKDKSVPHDLLIQPPSEEEILHGGLSATPTTPNSLGIFFPPPPSFLKRGDTIMALEDSALSLKMLSMRLKGLGFNVIDVPYGIDAYKSALQAAEQGTEIHLFLFDFNVPFAEKDKESYKDQPELNGGQTARSIRQITLNDKKPFEKSIFVCLTATPNDAEEYQDIFWQIRDKLVEPNAEDFFQEVRRQLMISDITSTIVNELIQRSVKRASAHLKSMTISSIAETPALLKDEGN